MGRTVGERGPTRENQRKCLKYNNNQLLIKCKRAWGRAGPRRELVVSVSIPHL